MAVLSKRAWWFWPYVVLCAALFFLALTPGLTNRLLWLATWGLSVAGLYFATNVHEKRVKRQQAVLDRALLQEFLIKARSGEGVSFTTSKIWNALLAAVVAGFSLMLVAAGTLGSVLLGLVLFCVFLLLGLDTLVRLVGPPFMVSMQGVHSHLGCLVPWSSISGISLEKQVSRGLLVGHRLVFRVDDLLGRTSEMSFAARLYYRLFSSAPAARRVVVELNNPSESPELIHKFSETLWEQVTGNKNYWHSGMSEDMHSALTALGDLDKKVPDLRSGIDVNEAMAWAKERTRLFQDASHAFNHDLQRIGHWSNGGKIPTWVAVVVIGLVLLGFVSAFYFV